MFLGCYCSPHRLDSPLQPVIAHLERAVGFHPRRRCATEARQARGLAGARNENVSARRAADRVAAVDSERRTLPAARHEPAAAARADAGRAGRTGRRAGGAASRCCLVWEDVHWADPTSLNCWGSRSTGCRVCRCWRSSHSAPSSRHPGAATPMSPADAQPPQPADAAAGWSPGCRRQGAAGSGAGADRGQGRRHAAVRRGADQGRARVGPAAGEDDRYEIDGPLPPLAIPATCRIR